MIGKGKALAGTIGCLGYGLRESKNPEIILRQYVVGDNARDIGKEFANFQEQYHGSQRKILSFVLSPTPQDGQRLERSQLQEIAQRFLKEMKMEQHQAVAIVHRDRDHVHLHLYVNRVNLMGKHDRNNYLNLRASLAAEQVARAMGLTTVKQVIQQKLEGSKAIRGEIKAIHDKVLRWERPRNFDRYMRAMEKYQVKPIPFISKKNELLGFRFEYRGQNFKGSEVHPEMAMGNITKQLFFERGELRRMIAEKKMPFMGKNVKVPVRLAQVLALKSVQMAQRASRDSAIEI